MYVTGGLDNNDLLIYDVKLNAWETVKDFIKSWRMNATMVNIERLKKITIVGGLADFFDFFRFICPTLGDPRFFSEELIGFQSPPPFPNLFPVFIP